MFGIPIDSHVELICFGTEEGRALGKRAVARSTVQFAITDAEILLRCIEDLRLFAAVLRNRPAAEVHYGWGRITFDRSTGQISFGLNWYDLDYFMRRRTAYTSRFHAEVLRRFKLSASDLSVSHNVHDKMQTEA